MKMAGKSYLRKGGIGDDYIEHEDGSKSFLRKGSIGDDYIEHEDGSKSFLRKGSIGEDYIEHEDGSKSYFRKGSLGDSYYEHEDGSMSLLRKGGTGDSYYEHVGGKSRLSTSDNDNENTNSTPGGGSRLSDIIAAPFAYLFGAVVIFFIVTAILQISGVKNNIAELIGMGIANTVFIGGIVAIIAYIFQKKTGVSNKIWIGVVGIWFAYFLITQLPIIMTNSNLDNGNKYKSVNRTAVSVNNPIIPVRYKTDPLAIKYIGTWEYDESGSKMYLKITKVQSGRYKFEQGYKWEGNIVWVDFILKNADGIYLKFSDGKMIGEFVSANFAATHGMEFLYKISIEIKSENRLLYSVYSENNKDPYVIEVTRVSN